jgi:hypothetical protein
MAQDHPFAITVECNIDIVNRFRWNIYEDGKLRERSPSRSYATKREALADAQKVLERLIAVWRKANEQASQRPARPGPVGQAHGPDLTRAGDPATPRPERGGSS